MPRYLRLCLTVLAVCTLYMCFQPVTAGWAADAPTADAKADAGAQQKDGAADAEKKKGPDKPAPDPWGDIWEGQRDYLIRVISEVRQMDSQFSGRITSLSVSEENEARRLLVLANTFKKWPNALEAVDRRLGLTYRRVQMLLEEPLQQRLQVQTLLERMRTLSTSLPDDTQNAGPEIKGYARDIRQAICVLMMAPVASIAPLLTENAGGDGAKAAQINSIGILLGILMMMIMYAVV